MSASIDDLASRCIRCGFCLESCPTFLETGEETESPRGRIHLAKAATRGEVAWPVIRSPLNHCLGCRACETACPSGVEYGALLEIARAALGPSPQQRRAVQLATNRAAVRLGAWIGRWMRHVPGSRQPMPTIQPVTLRPLAPCASGPSVALLEGCAMRVLFPNVHVATRNLLARAGMQVSRVDLGCCGALHAHNGMLDAGKTRAERVRTRAGGTPVVVNSAGCGAWLKECGVPALDVSEAIGNLDLSAARWDGVVTYHEACHLVHGQKVSAGPRSLIQSVPGVRFVELPEADVCCGSAGVYSMVESEMAHRLRDRKWGHIERALSAPAGSQPPTVVLGNPGCHAWIADAAKRAGSPIQVLHLAEFLEFALVGARR